MFVTVNIITLFGESKSKKALFRELYFYFLTVFDGIGVPTGYGDPSGAAVTDVCPFSVECGLRNGIAM